MINPIEPHTQKTLPECFPVTAFWTKFHVYSTKCLFLTFYFFLLIDEYCQKFLKVWKHYSHSLLLLYQFEKGKIFPLPSSWTYCPPYALYCVILHVCTYTHTTLEYISTTKRWNILSFAATYMNLEDILLSETSRMEKDKDYNFTHGI